MKIRDKLSSYGYDSLAGADRIELLLELINCRDAKTKLKQITEKGITLSDVFDNSEKAKGVFDEVELRGIRAVKGLNASYLLETLRNNPEKMDSPAKVAEYLRTAFQDSLFEQFKIVYLDSKNQIISMETASEGTSNCAIVYPRNIAKRALELNAVGVILSHNHPSGNCDPSGDDIRLTQQMADSLSLFDIRVLDHLIIGRYDGYRSFKESGIDYAMKSSFAIKEDVEGFDEKESETKSKRQSLIDSINEKFENLSGRLDSPETEAEIRRYLGFMRKTYKYSLGNQLLVSFEAMKRGTTPETVESFQFWSKLKNYKDENVHVLKGEKGYPILVPVEYRIYHKNEDGSFKLDAEGKRIPRIDPATGKEIKGLAFKSGAVFDVGQTNAREIGAYSSIEYRNRNAPATESMLVSLKEGISKNYNVSISEEPLCSTAKGCYVIGERKIIIDNRPGMTVPVKISTLFHELGHHIMHGDELRSNKADYGKIHDERGFREGEAEAFSYVLSSMFGIENKSELYIKNWGNSANDLKERFTKIHDAVKSGIETLKIEEIISRENRKDIPLILPAPAGHALDFHQQRSFGVTP
ncbi:MAG: JAB domain-containing protein [Victivallales bacterium]